MNRITAARPATRRLLRYGLPLLAASVCLVLLRDRLDGIETGHLMGAMRDVAPSRWIVAISATVISFWAIGQYDAVVHRMLRTGIPDSAARRSGAAAIALSQVLGLGVVTGTLARWRMLPSQSVADAARVTTVTTASFLAGWAVIAALVALALPGPGMPAWVAVPVLGAALALTGVAVWRPCLELRGHRLRLPGLRALGAILGLTAIDTLAAACALAVFLPEAATPGLAVIASAYLLALGAGLVTGAPGGVGPFELSLLTLLPGVPEADLIAAVLCFRLVYFALPACLALIPMTRPLSTPEATPRRRVQDRPMHRAELAVAQQNGAEALQAGASEGAVVETGQSLVLLFAPVRGTLPALLPALRREAARRNLVACAYKLSARDAVQARRAGWRVLRIADEAVIDTAGFDTAGPAHRQLRRKLRHAATAGVTTRAAALADHAALCALDAAWQAAHGRARGLTVGTYDATTLARQVVLVADQHGAPVAFISLHVGTGEYCLDLMRHGSGLPDGTIQALVVAAVAAARAAGLPRLSLAAMPATGVAEPRAMARLRDRLARAGGGPGLTRFKRAFGPRTEPLYAAAPGRAGLAVSLADLARAIHARQYRSLAPGDPAAPGIAFGSRTWETGATRTAPEEPPE